MPTTQMTGRERVMAALRHRPVDRIPWVPLVDAYTMGGFGSDVPEDTIEALHFLECDILARHVPVFAHDEVWALGQEGTWTFRSGVQPEMGG